MRLLKIILTGLMTLCLFGCAPRIATDRYLNPSYSSDQLKKIAILPIRNTRLNPNEAQQLDSFVYLKMKNSNPSLTVTSVPVAMKRINEHGLADDWADFIANYHTSGIPDADVLNDVGRALDVDAVVQGEILEMLEQDGIVATRMAETWLKVRYSMFGCQKSELMWQVTTRGNITRAAFSDAAPMSEMIDLITDELSRNLPIF